MLEVDASDPIAVVGRSKAVDEATLRALSSIVSGPRSSPEERKRWPAHLTQDPIVAATSSGDRLVLRFRGEDDVKVWCWKMAHQVFANEGAGLLYTQNVSFEYPCAPTNLVSAPPLRLRGYCCGRRDRQPGAGGGRSEPRVPRRRVRLRGRAAVALGRADGRAFEWHGALRDEGPAGLYFW